MPLSEKRKLQGADVGDKSFKCPKNPNDALPPTVKSSNPSVPFKTAQQQQPTHGNASTQEPTIFDLMRMMTSMKKNIKDSIKELKNTAKHFGNQLVQAAGTNTQRQPGHFPGKPVPKETANAITTRGGVSYKGPQMPINDANLEKENNEVIEKALDDVPTSKDGKDKTSDAEKEKKKVSDNGDISIFLDGVAHSMAPKKVNEIFEWPCDGTISPAHQSLVKGEEKDSHMIPYVVLPTLATRIGTSNALLFPPTPNIKTIIQEGVHSTKQHSSSAPLPLVDENSKITHTPSCGTIPSYLFHDSVSFEGSSSNPVTRMMFKQCMGSY
uniref:Uncharacterized protein n=1 Tax=Chenopodium quinoa TaxID=63459 RepID=A0A803MUH3_CHEQI